MPRHPAALSGAFRRRSLAGASVRVLLAVVPAVFAGGVAHAQTTHAQAQGSHDVNELVVTGQRLSTEVAITEQKEAIAVTNVVSADNLGKLPDANVADALARVPGVNVIVNQDTGEGEYVSVRGLAGTFNSYSINGVRVAETDPDTRAVSLTVLPPNGLQAIKVSKTLTPDMDGDAIGGAVDFRTPTAFDFKKTTMRAFASYGINDRASEHDLPASAYQFQADLAHKFGNDRFGIYGTAYWGKTHGANEESENDGEWEPFHWRKDSEEPIDAHSLFLPGIDNDFRRNEQTRYGGNFSLDYHGADHTLYLRGQYSRFERVSDVNVTDFRSRPTPRLVQKNIDDTSLTQPEASIVGHGAKGNIYSYTTNQIVDQDGDGIITDGDRAASGLWSLNGRSGIFDPQAFQFARSFSVNDENQSLGTINFGGQSRFDRLTLDYDLSYSWGDKEDPNGYSVGYNCDACQAPFNQTGIRWSSPDPRFPEPQLPAAALAATYNDALLPFDGAGLSSSKQTDERLAFKLDGRYKVGGLVDYLKAGFKVMQSTRKYDNTPIWDGDLPGATLADSGLVSGQIDSLFGGRYNYGSVLGRSQVISAIDAARRASPKVYGPDDLYGDDKAGRETIYAGYGLANFKFDDAFELIAGVRVEHTKVHNRFWVSDSSVVNGAEVDTSHTGTTDRDYTVALPSATLTYRPGNRFVYRGAVWTSFSRPEFQAISGGESISYTGAGANRIVSAISQGNPDLKPARSTNFDLSAEFYPDNHGMVSAGFFYKDIRNFIFTLGNTAESTENIGSIEITQPKNGQSAQIYGVELNLIKDLIGLPAPFDGFGVEANVTVQHSEAETGLDYRKGHKIPFVGAPDLLYNAALTYQKYGFEAKISFNYQGKYIESLRDNAVDKWVQHNQSLDFHSRYNIREGFSVDFDVQNILNGWRYYTTKGDSPAYQKDYMEPGRTFLVKVVYTR